MKSYEREGWMCDMLKEIKSLHKNYVWELASEPINQKVIGSKWVYQKKKSINGNKTPIYQARLVVKAFSQKVEVDYDEIFSPMVKHTSIWVLLSLVAQYNMELEQLDEKTLFLHGDLEKTSI